MGWPMELGARSADRLEEKGRGQRAVLAIKLWARRLLMSSGFAVDLRTSRVLRLDGLGSSVTE